jgi:hypothetical protein
MMAKLRPILSASGFALPARGPDRRLECADEPDKNYRVLALLTSRFLLHKYLCMLLPVSERTVQNTGRHSCSPGL